MRKVWRIDGERGFTLIELIMVIVLLGILAVVAIPKFVNMQTEAANAAADGVYGAAQAAAALNHAAVLVGKSATERPAYDATDCTTGLISAADSGNKAGTCLMNALEGTPDDWSASGNTITATINGTTYTITVSTDETTTAKAGLSKSW